MTYLRTVAATITLTIAFSALPQAPAPAATVPHQVDTVAIQSFTPMQPLPTLPVQPYADTIRGVRILAETTDDSDRIEWAVQRFENAGWPLENLEVRVGGEDDCGGHAGVHSTEDGHDVVEICTDAEFVLLHELGHVWSDRYLGEERRQDWLELRSLDSWHDAPWTERGTEHAAEIFAFGLLDDWTTPASIAPNDRDSLIEHFTWLFDIAPLHMTEDSVRVAITTDSANTETGAPSAVRTSFSPDTVGTAEAIVDDTTPTAGYRFPMACGFPRWHSKNGGYGYEDPRDWTHVGVDLYAYEGTPVVAPVHGLVLASDYGDSAGWNVRIEDATGRVHVLMHLKGRPTIAEGDRVRSGQSIGAVGRTGNASGGGPHIHCEIRDAEGTINPMPWLVATGSTVVAPAASDFYTGTAPVYSDCGKRA
jgi:hypothetical protein